MLERDPRAIIAEAPMSVAQLLAVAVTIALNGLDGFDVLAISFASPGIVAEWGIDRAALGVVLSMELFGMAIGSIILGNLADRFGRRPLLLFCLVIMATGMLMVTTASSIPELCAWRLFTGLGIGGMLAATNAAAAEHANSKNRNLCVSFMAIGYPIGAVLGGMVVAQLLKHGDWRTVFYFGGAVTLAFIPITWFVVPETIPFLCKSRRGASIEKVNRVLVRMGHPAVTGLALADEEKPRSTAELFSPALVRTTILVTLAYFAHITTFYFILKWVPKTVVDMGFAASSAAGVLVWANVGGAAGGAVLGLLTRRIRLRGLAVTALLGSVLAVSWYGRGSNDLANLSIVVAVAGFFTNAGVVSIYAIIANAFPTELRATGTGFSIGVGRAGAALSPIIAGLLFQGGVSLQGVAIVMASGALIAAGAIMLMPGRDFRRVRAYV
jgi:benzoate transport